VIAAILAAALVACIVPMIVGGPDAAAPLILLAACLAMGALAVWRVAAEVGPHGVDLHGPLRSKHFPWDQIEGFRWKSGDSAGLYLMTTDRRLERIQTDERRPRHSGSTPEADLAERLEAIRRRYQQP
jgi:hypothetical protein